MGLSTGLLKTLTVVNVGVLVVNLLVTLQATPGDQARMRRVQPRDSRPGIAREAAQPHAHRVAVTGPNESRKADAPREVRVKLTEKQLQGLLEDVYREERLWRRTAGVLHALSRLQKKGVLPELSEPARIRIVALVRQYAGQRVRLERAVMSADVPNMRVLRGDLVAFDQREIERIQEELNTFLNAAEAVRIARVIVPGTT